MMGSEQFLLKWNNHQTNFVDVFGQLLHEEAFTDVTLACEGRTFVAHKIVLSACSPYFHNLFVKNPCKHPIVFLRDVKACEIDTLLQYIYKGEVHVSQNELAGLLKTATALQIKGLAEVSNKSQAEQPPTNLEPLPLITPRDLTCPVSPSSVRPCKDDAVPLTNGQATDLDKDKVEESMNVSQQDDPDGNSIQVKPEPPDPLPDSALSLEISKESSTNDAKDVPREPPILLPATFPTSSTWSPPQLTAKKGPYYCHFCGECFKAREHLNRHIRIHTGEKPFPCLLCGKCFARKDHLKIHILIHTGEKPYACRFCEKRFTQKQTLQEHENVHLGRKPFKCLVCAACFPARGNLKYHKRSVHGIHS